MNETILLAMKWLKDPKSVSREELNEAAELAFANYHYAPGDNDEAEHSALGAMQRTLHDDHLSVSRYVDEYFKFSGESREEYEKELSGAGRDKNIKATALKVNGWHSMRCGDMTAIFDKAVVNNDGLILSFNGASPQVSVSGDTINGALCELDRIGFKVVDAREETV